MIKIESPNEFKHLIGAQVMEVSILDGSDPCDEPFCADEEILLDCYSEGKKGHLEVRIYIDKDGNLCIYTD